MLRVNIVSFNQSEENLRQLITDPLCSVITDGFYVKGQGAPQALWNVSGVAWKNVIREQGVGFLLTAGGFTKAQASQQRV